MKVRILAAVALAAALAAAASTATGSTQRAAASKVTVWVMTDAQNGWPGAITAANNAFKQQHPGVDIDIQYQSWNSLLAKFDAALAANDAPDVIELGNTQITKYMAAGAFSAIKAKNYPNSSTWLSGLKASCTYNGKLYCVPYYAGARAVIYRKDLYRSVGVTKAPTTYAQFLSVGNKLLKKYGSNKNFSPFYQPGQNWYAAMSFVYDYDGQIAVQQKGKWKATLDTPQAIKALTAYKSMVRKLSRASKTQDEAHPFPSIPFAKGRAAAFLGNGWEWPYVFQGGGAPKSFAKKMGAYPLPSHIKGRYVPTFLGGSILGIPINAKSKSLGADWIKAFTNTGPERIIAKAGNIANTTKLADVNKSNPQLAPFANAAKYSWFIPTSPNWVNVENSKVLKNMCTAILTNRKSVKAATQSASATITKILNAKS
ncbi:MAG TPA: extracellular solute-binding protein [Gaiellaceae bacterium]|jgi:N,N'-diacetylchitobiose transport system substrate-binding protein